MRIEKDAVPLSEQIFFQVTLFDDWKIYDQTYKTFLLNSL